MTAERPSIQGFGRLWQKTYRVRLPSEGAPAVEVIAAWRRDLPPGLVVLHADATSVTAMTPAGRPVAAWIALTASEHGGETVAQAQVLMRALGPLHEARLALGGHRRDDRSWPGALARLAQSFGQEAEVETDVVCVDRRRQWSRWRGGSAARRAVPVAR